LVVFQGVPGFPFVIPLEDAGEHLLMELILSVSSPFVEHFVLLSLVLIDYLLWVSLKQKPANLLLGNRLWSGLWEEWHSIV
jgi:hypothetical protein